MLTLVLASAFLFQGPAWDVSAVTVKGAQRLSGDALAGAVGLRKGGKATRADLDRACEKMVESGLVRFCNYKYVPVSERAVSLELQVQETPADQDARITVPNIEEQKIWDWLAANEPLVKRTLPGSEEATTFYLAAIHRCLKALGSPMELKSVIDADNSGKLTLVFRPAHLAAITDVRFKGTVLFTEKKLRDTLMAVAGNTPYTEFDFRRLLDLNIRTLYDEAGRLGMAYKEITAEKQDGGVAVTTTIVEGPVYVLKSAKLTGEGISEAELLPVAQFGIGKTANWRAVQMGLHYVTDTLKAQGYLEAKFELERKLNDQEGTVDAVAVIHRGDQFVFGGLEVAGVPSHLETKVRALWQLPQGAPLSEAYTNDFLRSAFKLLGEGYRTVSKELAVRPGSRIVDVTAKFGR